MAHGEALGSRLGPGDVVALFGELGSGKTTLAKGIARGAGVGEEVFSPSFTLIHEHRGRVQSPSKGRVPFYHIDLYRLTGAEDIEQLGLEEYLYGQGIVVIEWADRARGLLHAERIDIGMDFAGDDRRAIQISGTSERMQKIVGLVVSDAGACN